MPWIFLDRSQSLLIRTLGKKGIGITVISAGSTRSFVTLMMEMVVVTMTCVPASLVVVMVVMELVEVTMTWVLCGSEGIDDGDRGGDHDLGLSSSW